MSYASGRMIAKKEGAIGWMIFNQPEKRNAISVDMWQAVPQILDEFAADAEIRVVVLTGSLPAARLPSSHFDVITLWDVIEHLPDPDVVLAETRRLLKPGGRLVITTGDIGSAYARRRGARWHLLAPPWHLYYFSQHTLRKLAAKAGLEVVGCQARGVASDYRILRTRLGVALANLLGYGDIMKMTLAPAA